MQVRVTLDRPQPPKGTLVMRFGTTDAIKLSDDKDYSFKTGHRAIAGKPILFPPDGVLVAGDPENDSTLMPEEVAKHFFGDWDIPQETTNSDDPRATHGVEMRRVARVWGDFKMKGGKEGDTTPLGPPNIPYVTVRKIDARGNVIPDFEYRPREHYGFDTMPYEDDGTPRIEVTAAMPHIDIAAMRESMLKELREELYAKSKQKGVA